MKIQDFPWSPVVTGLSSGVAGFGLAALAAGLVHFGSGDSCRVAARHDAGDHRSATLVGDPQAASPCHCCCAERRVIATDCQDESPQLSAIEECATTADSKAVPPAVQATSTVVADLDPAGADAPIVPLLDRTSILAADPVGEFAAASSPLAARLGLVDPVPAPAVGSSWTGLGGPSGGGGFGGGGGASRPAAGLGVDSAPATPSSLAALVLARDRADMVGASSWLADLGLGDWQEGVASLASTGPIALAVLGAAGDGAFRGSPDDGAAAGLGAGVGTPSPAFPVTTVPEPAALVMTLVGIGLASGVACRRSIGWRSRP